MRRQRPVPTLSNLASARLYRCTKCSHAACSDARALPACSRATWLQVIEAMASLYTKMTSQSPMLGWLQWFSFTHREKVTRSGSQPKIAPSRETKLFQMVLISPSVEVGGFNLLKSENQNPQTTLKKKVTKQVKQLVPLLMEITHIYTHIHSKVQRVIKQASFSAPNSNILYGNP